jgi:ABC-2 type transport system permease protein
MNPVSSLRPILSLLRKDFTYFRRDRGSVILTFLVPFALIYLFGMIFGVNRPDRGPIAAPLAVVDESGTPEAAKLVAAFRAERAFQVITSTPGQRGAARPLTEADLRPMIRQDRFRFAVVLPRDFVPGDGQTGLHLKLLSDPRNAIETQTMSGLLEKTLFATVPQLLNLDSPDDGAGGNGGDPFSHFVKIDREQVSGGNVENPMATQLVGGWAMQFLLFALVASSTSLFHERDHGIFQRILSGPVPRSAVLLSKFLYGIAIGLLQLFVLFGAGRILFGITILPYFPLLALVCLCAAAACSAFGMLLASIAKTPEMSRGLSTFVILLMSALGGAWFPLSMMPESMQRLSRFTLVYWSIKGFLQVLWDHVGLAELLPTLGVLVGLTVALLALAWWRFDRGRVFD